MIDWVKLAVLALELAGDFARWVEREKLRTEAERKLLDEARRITDANVARAEAARTRVRARLDDPNRLRDDPFLRPDDWTGDRH